MQLSVRTNTTGAVPCAKTNTQLYAGVKAVTCVQYFVADRDARLGGDVSMAFFMVGGPFGILAGWYVHACI